MAGLDDPLDICIENGIGRSRMVAGLLDYRIPFIEKERQGRQVEAAIC